MPVFESVVVGATNSAGGARALARAVQLVRASGGQLHAVAAVGNDDAGAPWMPEEFRYTAMASGPGDWALCQAKAQAASARVPVTTHPVLADPATAIAMVARQEGADLIVVGAGERHGERHLSGVDQDIVDHAGCPVLIV